MRGALWWIDRWRQSQAFTDMTAEEQGLYRNLCDELWLREDHTIPDDQRILSRVSGDPEAWARCGAKVLQWMTLTPAGWTNQAASEVIAQSKRRADKQARYRNKARNATGNETGNQPGSPFTVHCSLDTSTEERKDPPTRPGSVLGSSPLGEILQPDRTAERETLKALRVEIGDLEREVSALTRTPVDVLRSRESRPPGGRGIVNPESIGSVRWLEVYRDKLVEARLRARADAHDTRASPPQADPLADWLDAQGGTLDDLGEQAAAFLREHKENLESIRDPVDRAAHRVALIRRWGVERGAPNGAAGVVEVLNRQVRAAEARLAAVGKRSHAEEPASPEVQP